jgi:hypothetical protein
MSGRDALGVARWEQGNQSPAVLLKGGTFDGRVWRAQPPPHPLRIPVQLGTNHWTEIYLYAPGQTVVHPELGILRVMAFLVSESTP